MIPLFILLDSDAAREHLSPEDAEQIAAGGRARDVMARHTVIHEAQHVAMERAGEDNTDFSAAGLARQTFLNVAHQEISEYRAELGLPRELRNDRDSDFPLESLNHLHSAVQRNVTIYLQHRDVDCLAFDVVQEKLHLWISCR